MAAKTGETDSISLAIVGSGGAGALTTGAMLLEIAGKCGLYGMMTRSVGPQIRGGEAAALVRLSSEPVGCMDDVFDLLIAIDWRKADRFAGELALTSQSLVIGDPEGGDLPDAFKVEGATIHDVPLKELSAEITGGRPNMVALGLACALLGLPEETIFEVMQVKLHAKGESALVASRVGIEAGFVAAADIDHPVQKQAKKPSGAKRWMISGNEAAGLGAVRGGVRFVAAYPITPATEVLEWLAPALLKVGGVLVQAEDELASINMIIGASFGGKPSLTATSGPGLALMVESLGLATAAEMPIVVIDVMRGGPSTGIPTKSEQSDLNIAVNGCHGDAPHIVVAPLSIADCMFTTQWAVHLAEAMQVPAIVLSDQFLGQTRALIDPPADVAFIAQRQVAEVEPENAYRRYAVTSSGVSAMALPGTAGGQYTADGLTHNEKGLPSGNAGDHASQLDKRRTKLEAFNYGDHWGEVDGDGRGETAIITWGSLSGAAREAAHRLNAQGVKTRLIAQRLLAPFPETELVATLEGVKRALVVEQTHSGQFHRYLRAMCDLPGDVYAYHRPGPLAIGPDEIVNAVLNWRS